MDIKSGRLAKEKMIALLEVRKETATQDYRRELPPRGHKTCAFLDLLKDLVAMANIGGGVIIFGVENDNFTPVGLDRSRSGKRLDDTDITRAMETYLEIQVPFELAFFEYKNKEYAFLSVAGVSRPLLFYRPAVCDICGERAVTKHFYAGATFIRQGSNTVRASQAWVNDKLRDQRLAESASPTGGVLMNNLPGRNAIYDTFVGRVKAFDRAAFLLRDQRRRVTWIQGSGGIGKTALAYRLAETIVTERDFVSDVDYVVWISAKENALTLDGIEPLTPTLTKLSDIVRAIAEATRLFDTAGPEVTNATDARSTIETLNPILKDHTGLLVLDNLETVNDNEVLLFLQSLPGHTRALATTRRSMDSIGGDTLILEPMSLAEAEELIQNEAVRTGRSWLTADHDAIAKVIELSGRIPLAIRLIVPRLESMKTLRNYAAAAPKHEKDLLEFCYEQTFRELTPDERKAFFALSLFEDGASLADLAFMLGTDLNDPEAHESLLQRIERLWHLSLAVIKPSGVQSLYDMQSLVRRFAARRLATDAKLKQELKLRQKLHEVRKADDIYEAARKAWIDYQENNRYEDATAMLEECLRRDPKCIEALLTKAELELVHGRHLNKALSAATHARELSRQRRDITRATAVIADCAIRSEEYRKALEELVKIDPSDADLNIHLLMADCYYQISVSASDVPEAALANQKEAAEHAKTAAKQARRVSDGPAEGRACAIWAKAALSFSPAVALQAAERAIERKVDVESLRAIRVKALTETKNLPHGDVLGLDE